MRLTKWMARALVGGATAALLALAVMLFWLTKKGDKEANRFGER